MRQETCETVASKLIVFAPRIPATVATNKQTETEPRSFISLIVGQLGKFYIGIE